MSIDLIAGENSIGAWLSGAFLIISSTITAVIASRRGWYPWIPFTIFFMLLAIDEKFMIHEAIKRKIVFSNFGKTSEPVYWIGEIPVILAACVGAVVAWILWKNVSRYHWLIAAGVIFGIASVTFDVLTLGVLWEDSFKLIGEMAICSVLVIELNHQLVRN
jgi:hypothetical protein